MELFLLILKWVLLTLFAFSIVQVIVMRWIPVQWTPLMKVRCRQQRKRGEQPRLHHQWIPLQYIPNDFKTAVWVAEDGHFISHFGFDIVKTFQHIKLFFIDKEGFRQAFAGLSTISQQTAKNVFLWSGKSLLRKALECYYTILIELFWGKQRIMEVYLNSIEMGDGIYGVYAAAKEHYHCEPDELTREQIANIVTCLPNPLRYHCTNIEAPSLLKSKERILMGMEGLHFPEPHEFHKVQWRHRLNAIQRIFK